MPLSHPSLRVAVEALANGIAGGAGRGLVPQRAANAARGLEQGFAGVPGKFSRWAAGAGMGDEQTLRLRDDAWALPDSAPTVHCPAETAGLPPSRPCTPLCRRLRHDHANARALGRFSGGRSWQCVR